MCTKGSENIPQKLSKAISMLFLHSLRGNGSITIKGEFGISIDDMEANAFGFTLSTDGHSPTVSNMHEKMYSKNHIHFLTS